MIPSLIAAGMFPNKASAIVPGSLLAKPDPKPTLFERFRLQHKYILAGHRSHSSHASHASHSSHRSSSGGGYSYSRPSYTPPARSYTPPSTPSYVPRTTSVPDVGSSTSGGSVQFLDGSGSGLDDPSDWEVVGVIRQTAWLHKKSTATSETSEAVVGAEISGLGTVLSINDSDWSVTTDAGIVRLSDRASVTRNLDSVPNSSILPSSSSVAPKVLPGNSEKFKKIVMQVQTALYTYGYYTSSIDGVVGPNTRVALSKMQSDYGLKVTGTVTPEVLDALGVQAQ
ncbi:hypothetical protein E3C22_19565 [Jiella endophytica]|uniref:Peptidoglycan binding-like domain-containing protein n=1 Tax=Jiella endophytica TaxID=2558362 RepID=A0A4Y8RCW7_9HYPH|nr:peptidoglycan-binding protein [Jiella endophytica]TFF19865.1 hypothetical protein E3C22_19565 [Jiella endophytica]